VQFAEHTAWMISWVQFPISWSGHTEDWKDGKQVEIGAADHLRHSERSSETEDKEN